jgi:hypothetical protein
MRRRIAFFLAAVCVVGAVLMAVLPYTGRSKVEVPDASNHAPDADGNFLNLYRITIVRGRCQPPVISAWRKDGSHDEGLWAVTVGTNMMGYSKATSIGRLCAHSARRRLLGSFGLGVLGVGAVLIGRRIPPPAASQAGPAPA